MFQYDEKITFSKAVYYNFNPVAVKKPWRDATGGFGNFVPLQGWIQIYDTDGNCGETFCSKGMVDNILPLILTGETRSYQEWYDEIYWKFRNFGFQSGQIVDLGQLDLIMLEIMARRAGQPLHRFLGAKKDWAAVYKGGGSLLSDDQELVEDMVRYVEEGYKTVKFKVGSDWGANMERDARRMEMVRAAVGPDVEIAVDANQVWNVEQALQFADLIRPYHPAWFEEPVHSHDMNAVKELKDRGINMKLGYGESMRNYYSFETYAEKGLRFSSGGTVHLNAVFGALYGEDELLENHEPMTAPIGDCLKVKPEEKNGRIYLPDMVGTPIRVDFEKLEKNGTLESVKCVYADSARLNFAVRAAY